METTIVHWGYMWITEKKMEATTKGFVPKSLSSGSSSAGSSTMNRRRHALE